MATRVFARLLRILNRWFMVPMLRGGLGAWVATPFGGYILLLRVRGRRTGLIRDVPLTYLLAEGSAWVLAGFGAATPWYGNLVADPKVTVWLPGRILACDASTVDDPATRARIVPALVRAAGVPGLLVGVNPWRAPDEVLVRAAESVPLVRLTPVGPALVPGPDDPGGWAWVWRQSMLVIATVVLIGQRRPPAGRRHAASWGA